MKLEKVTVARADGQGQVGHFRSPSADTYLQLNVNVELNRIYTLHGYIKSAANGTLSCLGKSVGTTTSWNHFSMQIIPNSKIFNLVFSPGEYWFYNFKLEKGTIMTQWSPNGEDLVEVKQHIVTMGSSINQLQDKITQKVWMTDVNTATGEVNAHLTNVEQTANKIDWLVKSGTDSSNMTLTDNTYSLIAKNIDLTGKVKFSSFDASTQSRLTPLKTTRTWTGIFTNIGTVTTCNLSDFNRTPVVGDIFSNTDGGSNTGTWQVTVVNGNSVTIKLLSCDAPAKSAADAASEAAKKAKAISDNIYSTNTTTINGGKITTGSITASQIAAGAITAEKISVSDLSSLKATIGGWTISDTGISNDFWNEYDKISYTISLNTPDAADSKVINLTKNNDSQFYIMQSGKMYAKNADISGTITSADINNGNGTFKVDKNGKVTASDLNMSGGSIALKGNLSNSTIDLKAVDNSGNNYELWMNGAVLRIVKNDENLITLYGTTGSIGAQSMYAQEIQSDKFREPDRGYAMCGDATGHTYHCHWNGSALSFQVDTTWVWSSSDKRLKKNIEAINQDYIDAVGSVDLFQYNLNRQGYSDKPLYFGAMAQDIITTLKNKGHSDDELKMIFKDQVTSDDATLYYGMDYEQFLILRVAYDEQKISKLENQLDIISRQFSALQNQVSAQGLAIQQQSLDNELVI